MGVVEYGRHVANRATPLPNPPPQGGREQTESAAPPEYTSPEHSQNAFRFHNPVLPSEVSRHYVLRIGRSIGPGQKCRGAIFLPETPAC